MESAIQTPMTSPTNVVPIWAVDTPNISTQFMAVTDAARHPRLGGAWRPPAHWRMIPGSSTTTHFGISPPMNRDAIRAALDQALASPSGIRLDFVSKASTVEWRMAAYALRRHEAAESRAIYPPHHPSHGASPYDALVIRFESPATLTVAPREPAPTISPLLAPNENPLYPPTSGSSKG